MSVYDKKFKINSANYNVHNDISLVEREVEERSNSENISEIFSKSITNIIFILSLIIMDCLNLIFLGQNNKDFTNFETAIIYLNIFCFSFSIGIISSTDHLLDKAMFDGVKIFKIYMIAKDHIIFVVLFLVIPVSLISYYIIFDFFDIWHIYINFLIYAPLIIFFKLLILLNLKTLYKTRNNIWIIVIFYNILHVSFLSFFVKSYGIFGVTLTMILASLITFIFSHVFYVTKLFNMFNFSINSVFKMDWNASKETLLTNTVKGFYGYLNYLGYGLMILSAYSLTELYIAHIIIYSILSVPHTLSEGFSITIRKYLSEMKHTKASFESRKKYLLCFVILVITITLTFALLLITLQDRIVILYYPQISEEMKNIIYNVILYYSIFIIFDYFSIILDGFIIGKEGESLKLPIYKAVVFCLICLPIGLFVTYNYNLGITGIWWTGFGYTGVHFLANMIYVYKVHGLYAFKE